MSEGHCGHRLRNFCEVPDVTNPFTGCFPKPAWKGQATCGPCPRAAFVIGGVCSLGSHGLGFRLKFTPPRAASWLRCCRKGVRLTCRPPELAGWAGILFHHVPGGSTGVAAGDSLPPGQSICPRLWRKRGRCRLPGKSPDARDRGGQTGACLQLSGNRAAGPLCSGVGNQDDPTADHVRLAGAAWGPVGPKRVVFASPSR